MTHQPLSRVCHDTMIYTLCTIMSSSECPTITYVIIQMAETCNPVYWYYAEYSKYHACEINMFGIYKNNQIIVVTWMVDNNHVVIMMQNWWDGDGPTPFRPLIYDHHIFAWFYSDIYAEYHESRKRLTHWGRVTHICVGNLTTIDTGVLFTPSRRHTPRLYYHILKVMDSLICHYI